MGKLVSIDKKQNDSVVQCLKEASEFNFDSVIVVGYENGKYRVLHSSGVSLMEEIGSLECAKDCLIKSAEL